MENNENEQEFTGLKVQESQFSLEGIKMDNKTKICKVDFILDLSTGPTSTIVHGSIKPSYQCNDTMQGLLESLKEYLCDVRKIKIDERSNVNAVGVVLYGDGDTASWNILGEQKPYKDAKKSSKLDSNKVNYKGGLYLWESEVIDIIEVIKTAAFNYIFKNAQLVKTLWDESENKTDNPEVNDGIEDVNVVDDNETQTED